MKAQINKLGLIKLESFCTAKEISNERKRQSIEWGETIWQMMWLISGLHPTYSSYSSTSKLQTIQFQNGQNTQINTFQRGSADGQQAHEKAQYS